MWVLSEAQVKKIASPALAFAAVSEAFIAAYQNQGKLFPVVIAEGCNEGNIFSIKSGHLKGKRLSGLKMGSYWAENHKKGLPNHSTTTLLLDEETGITRAVINAGYLNGLRTAAANAVASHALARKDVSVLGVLGAGHQAIFEVQALSRIRDFQRVLISSRSEKRVNWAIDELGKLGITAQASDAETVCRQADLLTTVTNARDPLFESAWIKPGTHISAMGADQAGKQELPIPLVESGTLFADMPAQSKAIGEFERAARQNPNLKVLAIGAVLTGDAVGRTSNDEVTIFDSSGIALQDLCIAETVLEKAIEAGLALEVLF